MPHAKDSDRPWRVPIAAAAGGLMMVLLAGASIHYGNRMITRHAPLMDAAMAHPWYEEILDGDHQLGMGAMWNHLARAGWFARAMLEGGSNPEGAFLPLDDTGMRQEIRPVRDKLAEFRQIIAERIAAHSGAAACSDIDQGYDTLFADFMAEADRVETGVQGLIAHQLGIVNLIQRALRALILRGTLVAILLLRAQQRRWRDQVAELNRSRDETQASGARYRSVVNYLPLLIWGFGPGGVNWFVNRAYEEYLAKPANELIRSVFLALIPETDRAMVKANIAALTQERPIQCHEQGPSLAGLHPLFHFSDAIAMIMTRWSKAASRPVLYWGSAPCVQRAPVSQQHESPHEIQGLFQSIRPRR